MCGHDLTGQVEPKSEPCRCLLPQPGIWLEELRQHVAGDPRAVIADLDHGVRTGPPHGHVDRRLRGVLDGIGQEIDEYLLQTAGVRPDEDRSATWRDPHRWCVRKRRGNIDRVAADRAPTYRC